MESKNINWGELGFQYTPVQWRYVSNFADGKWDEGGLSDQAMITINESACVLHYSQTCFEGLRAYTTADGKIVVFRPDQYASRMADSCRWMKMPVFPEERFVEAVVQTVRANAQWVPPYGSGAFLYLRPTMFGSDPVLGVKPANEFQFRVFATPVGPYFQEKAGALTLRISDYDRAAPKGAGHVKAGLNYALSMFPTIEAHKQGYDENVYLDSTTRTYIEETGGANIFFISKEGKLVTPKSDTILPSITKRSLLQVARDYLGMETEERAVTLAELGDFAECGLCSTSAVISPVGKIVDHEKEICFAGMGPVIQKLSDTLKGIELGRIGAPEGWLRVVGRV